MQRILGQPHAIELLRQALASGRMHHAWIFHGPKGVGKCTAAVELAKILLDPDAITAGDAIPRSIPTAPRRAPWTPAPIRIST